MAAELPRLLEALPKPIGFALGGGGSLGAVQVGMAQALSDHGVHPDLVAGTSIGAINGALLASDPQGGASRLSHLWNDVDAKALLPGGILRRLWILWRTKTHLYDTPAVARVMQREVGDIDITELAIPYAAMALDVETGSTVRLTSGRLASAIEASSAIPGVFPAVERYGRTLWDGGLLINVPVLEALDMGAASLVVCDCVFPDQRLEVPRSLADTVVYAMAVQMREQALRDMPIAARSVPVLYLPGPRPRMVSPLDFRQTSALMSEGYVAARSFLDTVTVDGPGLYRRADHPEPPSAPAQEQRDDMDRGRHR